ncbi:MAG: oxidoreductase [Acidimicrobiia bacterium]|nr:MAG: oxidoreductase [Acidimicrobiia bacterium]
MTRTVATHCRICEALCGIIVEVDGDRVVSVKGDPADPISAGYTCPKGRAIPVLHHHPRRYDYPMIRRGGDLLAVDWGELLDDLEVRLRDVIGLCGPDAVGIYAATGSAFDANGRRMAEKWLKLMGSRSRYTSATIDTPCKPMVAEMMCGFAGAVPALDRENPELVLLIGVNPVVSHGHLNAFPDPVTTIRRLAAKGEVWVIDPRRSESARLATRHLAPRPSSDWALLAFLVREALRDGVDRDRLQERADGVDRLEEAVSPYHLEEACRRTGLGTAELAELSAAVRTKKVAIQTGTGVTMSAQANVVEWLSWTLQVVTDSFDRPGGCWFHPGYLRALETRRIEPTEGRAEPGPPSRPELPRRLGEYPVAAMLDEIEAGNLRALFVLGGNPITAFPEADRTKKALASLEVLVVADIVANEMTPFATHVLPCADQLERSDLPVYVDQFLPVVMTKYSPQVVPPGARRRPMWWPFAQLGRRFGIDVIGEGIDPDLATDDDLLRPLGDRSRSDFAFIRTNRVVINDPPQMFGWFSDKVLAGRRWQLAPQPLLDQLAGLARAPAEGLRLIPRRQVRRLNSVLSDPDRPEEATLLVHPEDAVRVGIADGQPVLVSSELGTLRAIAVVSDSIRPGAVSLPHGYADPNVSALTSARQVDPLTGMVTQSGLTVRLSPVSSLSPTEFR